MIRCPAPLFRDVVGILSAPAEPDPVPAQVKEERAKTEPDKPEPELHVPRVVREEEIADRVKDEREEDPKTRY
jgi:hypothetical protein